MSPRAPSPDGDADGPEEVFGFSSDSGPDRTFVLDDPAMLRAFYEPLRYRLISALRRPQSVKELADELGETVNRLYYHVRLLERLAIIEVDSERQAGSNQERVYRRSARRYAIAPDLWNLGHQLAVEPNAVATAETFARYGRWLSAAERELDLADAIATEQRYPLVQSLIGRLSVDRANEMAERLSEIAHEYIGPTATPDSAHETIRIAALVVVTPASEETAP